MFILLQTSFAEDIIMEDMREQNTLSCSSRGTFSSLFTTLPESISRIPLQNPKSFLKDIKDLVTDSSMLLTLVDKTHPLPADYVPTPLVRIADYGIPVRDNAMLLQKEAVLQLAKMAEDAAEEGIILTASSAYRSYNYQKSVFQYNVRTLGEKEASRQSARPGTSQHQLGTVVDFGSITLAFGNTQEGKWLASNARYYGFSLSYPEGREEETGYMYEPWHFRYIGTAATTVEHRYFEGRQQLLLAFIHNHKSTLLCMLQNIPE